ncbi:MAG: SIR2 family protein [Bacilli bacterium]|nr:SIR2 family protein [Bacilli bacterium]
MTKHYYKLSFPSIPKMEQEIIDAIDEGNLLLFLGAGVSKLIGYPLWFELGKKLADRAVEKGLISLSEKEILLGGGFTPMQIVTILTKKFDDNLLGTGKDQVIEELSINVDEDSKTALQLAEYLSAYNATIVTTNADESLEKQPPLIDRMVLKNFREYESNKFRKFSIIHLHGSISEPKGMVFTSEEYAKAYNIIDTFGNKLKDLFDYPWTILFIGYGVAEFELLRYFLKFKDDKARRMFMLDGYLAKDRIKYDFDVEYYKSLGIYLLPYSREKDNYRALLKALRAWDKDVKTKTMAGSAAFVVTMVAL